MRASHASSQAPEVGPTPAATAGNMHAHSGCQHCLADPRRPGSANVAWAVAGIAVAALLVVLFLGVGSAGGNVVALTALPLLAVLACPIVMGSMMWMMMRRQH